MRYGNAIAILAVVLLLFTPFLDPVLSTGLAVVLLAALAMYKLYQRKGKARA